MWRTRLVATTTTLIGRHRCPAIRLLLASKPHTDARATAVPATSHRLAIETGLVGYLGGRRRVLCVRVLCAAGLRCVQRWGSAFPATTSSCTGEIPDSTDKLTYYLFIGYFNRIRT